MVFLAPCLGPNSQAVSQYASRRSQSYEQFFNAKNGSSSPVGDGHASSPAPPSGVEHQHWVSSEQAFW
jgi:hypothetical protein